MNTITIRTSPRRQTHSKGRILAIEPDFVRARTLQHVLRHHVRADFEIVKSRDEAIRSISERVPDLVLTSTFWPPPDEAALTAWLKQLPAAAHLQVITVPHFIDSEDAPGREPSKVLSFLKRRSALSCPACDPRTVGDQIETYLEQAHAKRLASTDRALCLVRHDPVVVAAHDQTKAETGLIRRATTDVNTLATSVGPRTYQLGRAHANDRRRARRRMSGELPWLWTVKVPWGADVKVVDISSQGVLLETTSKITPGSTVDLQVLGQDTNLSVPARMTRSEVAAVDAKGVRYRVAAAFARDLHILGLEPQSADASVTPTALADLLARVLSEVDHGSGSGALRTRFEHGLRRLLPVRDIQIRQAPVIPKEGSESVYFTVPRAAGRPILQAIFEPDYQPSAMEFRLLRAAASLAAVVLEFAPLYDDAQARVPPFTAFI